MSELKLYCGALFIPSDVIRVTSSQTSRDWCTLHFKDGSHLSIRSSVSEFYNWLLELTSKLLDDKGGLI